MVGWKEFKQLGVAVCHYRPDDKEQYHMPVCVGDSIHIVEQDADWYRGFLVKNRSVKGIVPKKYVHIKESVPIKIGNLESLAPKEPSIVQEITSVLREWGPLLKNLFMSNQIGDYNTIREHMNQLIMIRRDMMSRKLTKDDFRQKQKEATTKIDFGNMLLQLDLTVRDDEGDVINSETIGAIEIFRDHRNTVQRNRKNKELPVNGATQRHTLNLFVSVCNVICRVGDEADVIMALYDSKRCKFFSENYVIRWSQKGLPKDLDLLNNLRVLFSDLGSKDLKNVRGNVYLVCQVVRLGGMNPPPENETRPTKVKNILRRPFGVAALDVTSVLNGKINPDEDKQHFVPILPCSRNDFLETVIKEAVKAEEVDQRTHKGQGIWVSVRLLDGDLKQVKEAYPHLIVGNTIVARKMGFPEVIMPSDVRNDFYVTINSGDLRQGKIGPGERNIEITMQVCSRDGKPLGIRKDFLVHGRQSTELPESDEITHNVISMGGGAELQSEYKSVIYKHQDTPAWYETFKIAVPIEEFYNCHLKFSFKHVSGSEAKTGGKDNKPFAMSHVSFISADQTTLADGDHSLLVYSIDTKKSNDMMSYLSLPSMYQELDRGDNNKEKITQGPYTLAKNNSFQISTLACSTKLTHNVDLLGLLNWKANPAAVPMHLKNLTKVDGEEIVKFLQDTLDALFSILMQNSDSDIYDNSVFDALIFVIGLIGDRKYLQFKSVLELYIKETFSATLAYSKLSTVLKRYIDEVDQPQNHDMLYRSFKSIVYLMKLIVRSWVLFSGLNDNKGGVQFQRSMTQLFQAVADMMCYETNQTLKIQGAALKFLPGVIPDIINDKVLDRNEFAHLLIRMIGNIKEGRLSNQKLVCILDIVNSPLFKFAEPRRTLMFMIVEHIDAEIRNHSKDLDICAKIVSDIIHQIYTVGGTAQEDLVLLFNHKDLLRTTIQTVINMDRGNKLVQDYTAIMIAMLRQMTDAHYTLYLHSIQEPEGSQTHQNLADFLTEIILVFKDLITSCVFPHDWNEIIMVQNQVFLKALRCFSQTIKEKFSNPFEQQLWNNFFHCAISFLTQGALQLENFSSAKKRKIIGRYGDMRRAMGFEIRSMWSNLGQYKIRFIPELVGPFLEMTLIPEIELRRATLPIFFDMMQCEFYQNVPSPHVGMNGNFRQFENELITRMDVQVEGGQGDEQYIELFYVTIHEPCAKHQIMREPGLRFVEVIKKLLMRLLEYRTIIHDENKDNRMNCIVNLLNFYRDIERQEMYIRYLHKLCDLHLECNNYTEAAYTLLLYTRLLRWSDEHLDSILRSDMFPSAQTHRELKELLYHRIIDHFDKGKMWEKGIELCKELIKQYEYEVFDYEQLTSMLKKQADFYTKILTETRHPPGYYRVSYYGNGFPSFLSNKTFVYRGKEYEMLADFSMRIKEQFPNAKELTTLNPAGQEILESAGQFLQMNAVDPVYEPQSHLLGKNVSERILKYYKFNEVEKFTYSRPLAHTAEITDMWLERTDLRTDTTLPGILRWFPVTKQQTYKVSPLENACEAMIKANTRLQVIIEDHQRQHDLQINPLSMLLNGIIDAAVSGGISNYKPFFSGEYLDNTESVEPSSEFYRSRKEQTELVYKLKDLTTQQLMFLADGLNIHNDKCPEALMPFHENMVTMYDKLLHTCEQEYRIVPPQGSVVIRKHKIAPHLTANLKSGSFSAFSSSETSLTSDNTVMRKSSTPDKLLGRTSSSGIFHKSSPNKGHMKVATRNSNRVCSNYSTDSKDSGDSAEKKSSSDSPVIELNQTLTSARPPRPDTKSSYSRSRPSSGNSKPKLHAQLSLPTFLNGVHNQLSAQSNSSGSVIVSNDPTAATTVATSAHNTSLNSSVSFNITSNVYVESPLARLPEDPPRKILRSQSVKGPEASPAMFTTDPKLCRNNSESAATNGHQATNAGYQTKWESTGSLTINDSFDDSSVNMSSSPARASVLNSHMRSAGSADNVHTIHNHERTFTPTPLANQNKPSTPKLGQDRTRNNSSTQKPEFSSTPPPLPRKQSQVETPVASVSDPNGGYAQVKMRKHSHKGMPLPSLPPEKPPLNNTPPALPQKRTSVGNKSNNNLS